MTKTIRVEDAIVQRHAELAAKAFKDHAATVVLAQGMFRSCRCQAPGTWVYGFDVTTTPGYLFVTGDIGELIVTRTEDMISWSRGAIHDLGYFAEKVPHSIPTKEWCFKKAVEWLNEQIEFVDDLYSNSVDKSRQKLVELRDGLNGEMTEQEFVSAMSDSELIDGCDWPDMRVFNSNFLWCREAVKWLLSHI